MPVFNQSRSLIIKLIFAAAFLIILAQLFNLQVLSDKYSKLALDNAVYPKIVYPERGIIFDRKGKAILNNAIMYDLMVTPAEIKGIDTLEFCKMMEIDTTEFRRRILEARFKNSPVRPSIFDDLLTPELQVRFEENSWKFPGFVLVQRPVRVYPYNAAAHILGYVAEVNQRQIDASEGFYRMGDYVGQTGLESVYESVLMGQRGVQYLIRDNKNRLVGSYANGELDTAAIAGRGIRTSIDIELQQLAERMMTNKVGAVVALDPKTGGILAMASGPNFNPNELTGPERNKNYTRLVLDVSGPLLNRGIKGQYPPGSTFKPIGALVALDEGVISPSFGFPCMGRYFNCGIGKPACTHSGGGHAANLRLSIANSCNAYYAHVFRLTVDNPRYKSVKVGLQKWHDYLNKFGLGVRLGIDLPSEDRANIPDTAQYNREYRNQWNSCSNLTLGIGQDKMLVTPLQLANAICIIANKGYYYTPHFVERFDGETEGDTLLNKFKQKHEVLTNVDQSVFETVIDGMQDVVERGTARSAAIPGINVCAKTGTAENKRVLDGRVVQLKDNSVFVCFAPRENPKIAIAVVVENSGFGGTWAGPISSILMEKYLNDTLRSERRTKADEISAANLMPSYLERLQYKEDSIRARKWFEMTKDSSYIKKYVFGGKHNKFPGGNNEQNRKKENLVLADERTARQKQSEKNT